MDMFTFEGKSSMFFSSCHFGLNFEDDSSYWSLWTSITYLVDFPFSVDSICWRCSLCFR